MIVTTPHTYFQLREEDSSWDYRGEFTKRYTHGLHSYPAMMIPQVAGRLIDIYSKPGDTILDPFCGSGSVLVESNTLGRNSWGIDLNPVALLVARAKTTLIAPEELREANADLCHAMDSPSFGELNPPNFFNLEYWFKPEVIIQLARIKAAIDSVFGPERQAVKEFFLVSFSETVRLSSNSRSHEFKLFRYSPDKLTSHNPNVDEIFRDRVERNIKRMNDFYSACTSARLRGWCRPVLADSTQPIDQIPEDSIDAVVTSPPYGDSRTTVAYGQFSRLSAQWLGFDDKNSRDLDNKLLGGRVKPDVLDNIVFPSLRGAIDQVADIDLVRARQVLSFYLDLEKALQNASSLVRTGGYLCLVIGNRRVKRVDLPTDLIIAQMAAHIGLVPQRIIIRNIPSKRMPFKNSPKNVAGELEPTMHKEYIVVLKK